MTELQQRAAEMIKNGGFSAKPPVLVFDQPFEKRTGFEQLEALNQRTGIPNYSTGRAFSPSSLKKFGQNPMKYIEYVKERPKTEAERLEDFYNSRTRHFTIGQVFEDLLRYGLEETYDNHYQVEPGTLTKAVKESAHESGRKAVRKDDWGVCLRMMLTVKELVPEYVEKLRASAFEAPAYGPIIVGPNTIEIGGYLDSYLASEKHASDIKTIESIAEAMKRIFERSYGHFQYWMQPAVYHARHGFDNFDFMFVSKDEYPSVMLISFDREQLDIMTEHLKSTVLSQAAFCLENGFEKSPSQFWKPLPRIEPEIKLFV